MKKNFKLMLFLVFFLIIIYAYSLSINYLPKNLVVFEGESISIKTMFGLNLKTNDDTIQTSSSSGKAVTKKTGQAKLQVNFLNNFLVKNVNVDILPKTKVIPIGNIAGVKLYTSGVLVVGMSEIKGEDKKTYKPYENTGIKEGDTITNINDITITTTEELVNNVNKSNGNQIKIKYVHQNEVKECSITPTKINNNEYKIGLWVRDSAAGVGTVTFYEPNSKSFGALGHGITDIDTGDLINISSGEFITTKVLNITKGEVGTPGRIQGTVDKQKNIGTIEKNSKFGIYGKVEDLSSLNLDYSKQMDIALRDEIKIGKAKILCSLDSNSPQEFEIEIKKINKDNNYDNKSMLIEVTDKNLIEKTGGIIQGMSGSPIIQNGKFVGAVTHVLVNNPTKGYAVFGDIMVKQLKSSN